MQLCGRSESDSTCLVLDTYGVRAVVRPLEVHHAIEAGVRCAVALVAVRVEFLLRQDVAAALHRRQQEISSLGGRGVVLFRARRPTYLARERHHPEGFVGGRWEGLELLGDMRKTGSHHSLSRS